MDSLLPRPSLPAQSLAASGTEDAIGLFDSGVGGLSVLRAVAQALPNHNLVYFADQKYCPYGPRPADEIRTLSRRITQFLIQQQCRVVVIACNTASAAALYDLRATFPGVPFVGMEPAIKPAAVSTRSGKIAVLATRGTLAGDLFANTRAEYAGEVDVKTVYPPDWVARVERGEIASAETFASVREVVEPLLAAGVDEIALGCTHYPFLAPVIQRIAQGRAALFDPSEAVARRTGRLVEELGVSPSPARTIRYFTSGAAEEFRRVLNVLLAEPVDSVAFCALPVTGANSG